MLYSTGGLGVADDTVDRSLGGVSSAIGDGGLNWSSSKISQGMLLVKKSTQKNTKIQILIKLNQTYSRTLTTSKITSKIFQSCKIQITWEGEASEWYNTNTVKMAPWHH